MADFKAGSVRGDLILGMQQWDSAIKKATLGLAAIGTGLGLVTKRAIDTSAQFRLNMAEIATLLDDTGKKRLPEYARSVKEMMVTFGEPVENLTRGLYDIVSAGIDASKALNVLETATITARGALIYNSSQSNKAVIVLDFGADKTSTAGTFTITFPTPDASNAILRLA